MIQGDFAKGDGKIETADFIGQYSEAITSDIVLAGSLKIVIDCANAVAGNFAPKIFEDLGCEVIPLFCEVDGTFPNHNPDPSINDNLGALVTKVQAEKADLGIALDGDADRLVVVSPIGNIIDPDVLLMLFAKDIVSRNPGSDIIFDIKSTRRLNNLISGYGGRPLMWKSGHSHIKSKMIETGALLGGEFSGHIFFKERWHGFDDGIYAAARLLEILTMKDTNIDFAVSAFPVSVCTPEIRIPVAEEEKFQIIETLSKRGEFSSGEISRLDGFRVDFSQGWGLVRASNTSAEITLRFEADNDEILEKIISLFKSQLAIVAKDLTLDF